MTITGATEIFAVFDVNQHLVQFVVNGEVVGSSSHEYADTITFIANPNVPGHDFGGWFTGANGNGVRYGVGYSTTMPDNNLRLYAHLILQTHTVTVTINPGAVTTTNVDWNTVFAQPPNPTGAQIPTGHHFVRWATAPNGNIEFDFTTLITVHTRIYAVFAPNPHTVTLVFDTDSTTHNTYFGANFAQPVNPIPPGGYSFAEWRIGSPTGPAAVFPMNITGDVRLYAYFSPNQYTLRFYSQGTLFGNATTQDFGTIVTIPTTFPNRTGYIFMGWQRGTDIFTLYNGVWYNQNDVPFSMTMPVGGLTFTALWEAEDTGMPRLATPGNVEIIEIEVGGATQFLLVWDAVGGAVGYRIYLRGDNIGNYWARICIEDGFTNQLDITFWGPGSYTIQIVAISPDEDVILSSFRSPELTHIRDGVTEPGDTPGQPTIPPGQTVPTEYGRLAAPTITANDNLFTWNEVAGAIGYAIYLNGVRIDEVGQDILFFDTETLNLAYNRTYILSVRALGDFEDWYHSFQSIGNVFRAEQPTDTNDGLEFWWIVAISGATAGLLAALLFVVIDRNRRRG